MRAPQANSEVSALLGRIPSAVGYQPTLATDLGGLQERITTTKKGSITSVQARAPRRMPALAAARAAWRPTCVVATPWLVPLRSAASSCGRACRPRARRAGPGSDSGCTELRASEAAPPACRPSMCRPTT